MDDLNTTTTARQRWIQEAGEATPLAVKIHRMTVRIAEEVAGTISLATLGRQLRDTLTDEELGAVVMAALTIGGADEEATEGAQKIQADKARLLGASDSKAGRNRREPQLVCAAVPTITGDAYHVAAAYEEGYSEAVEWKPLDRPHLFSTATEGWQTRSVPGGGFEYRPTRYGFPVPWALIDY